MEFFNTSLLYFAAGGAIPVIIHLLNRQRFKRVRWAAMEFLLLAIKKTQRRLKIENLLLLLVRVLIMVFLAFAIARPYFRESPFGGFGHTVTSYIFVIDNSYSMGYKIGQKTSLDRAREEALKTFKSLKFTAEDKASIILMSDMPELTFRAESQKDLIEKIFQENIPLSDTGTSFPKTLQIVKQVVDEVKIPSRKIFIYTDMQRVAWDVEGHEGDEFKKLLADLSGDKNNTFYIVDVGPEKPENYAIVDLQMMEQFAITKSPTKVVADLVNYTGHDAANRTLSLYVDGEKKESRLVSLPANVRTSVTFSYDFVPDVDVGPHHMHVELEPDYLGTDDRRYLALDVLPHLKVLCVDGEPAEGGAFMGGEADYFALALGSLGEQAMFSIDKRLASTFSGDDLQDYRFVVLANLDYISEDKLTKLERYVEDGGRVFITLGKKTFENKKWFNENLCRGGQGLVPGEFTDVVGDERREKGYALTEIRWNRHPFQYFEEKDLKASLAGPRFFRFAHLKLPEQDPKISVLARFNDVEFSPAMIEKPFGKGLVTVFASSLDFDWHELPIPPYVILMNQLAYHLSSRPSGEINLRVGDGFQITLPMKASQPNRRYAEKFSLRKPREEYETVNSTKKPGQDDKFIIAYPDLRDGESEPAEGTGRRRHLEASGVYSIHHFDATAGEKPVVYFTANVPAHEGNLERITVEELRQFYPEFRFESTQAQDAQHVLNKPPATGFWKHLLYAVLGLLVIETLMAWWFGRFK